MPTELPPPPPPSAGRPATLAWVAEHLDGLWTGPLTSSERFTGGQAAASAALDGFDVTGYAGRRNEVWPERRRGASALSPWIRHGLLTLPAVWQAAGAGPARDVRKYRDELLWQEYARHLYARVGPALIRPVRYQPDERLVTEEVTTEEVAEELADVAMAVRTTEPEALARACTSGDASSPVSGQPEREGAAEGWPRDMACIQLAVGELERDGWLVNQTRMWLASQWTVRHHLPWRSGEDHFFRHLLDGSRAANRLGWQWTVGAGTGKAYGFSRWQVEKRAPGVCGSCQHDHDCPIRSWPDDVRLHRADEPAGLRRTEDPEAIAGPGGDPSPSGDIDAVWLTAESLGDDDPALAAHPAVPAVFVWDRPLLARLGLSAKRLAFLAECLGGLAERRSVEVHVGDPVEVLAGRRLAATWTPVPGWHRRRRQLEVTSTHPWPWLRRPSTGPVTSFSAWRKSVGG